LIVHLKSFVKLIGVNLFQKIKEILGVYKLGSVAADGF
jgi:hypothetical protein